MKSLGPSFPFYVDDFLGGTQHMTAAEVGAYVRLLCYQWAHGSVPKSTTLRARICGQRQSKIQSVMDKFSDDGKGGLINKKMDAIRAERIAYQKKQSDNAAARWASETDATALPPHMPPHMPEGMPKACSASASASALIHTHTPPPDLTGKKYGAEYGKTVALLPADLEKPLPYEAWFELHHRRGINPQEVIEELAALLSTEPAAKIHAHGAAAVIGWKLDDIAKRHRRGQAQEAGQSTARPEWAIKRDASERKRAAEDALAKLRSTNYPTPEQSQEMRRLKGVIAEANKVLTT